MMKKPTRIKLISTLCTLFCIAVVGAFAVVSYSWVTTNKVDTASGIKVSCKLDQTVGIINNTFDIYGYNIETDRAQKEESLSLGDYDAFIQKNNVYARRFVRAELYYPNTVKEGQKLQISVECQANHLFKTVTQSGHTRQVIDKYISNLIEFKFLDNFEGEIPAEEEDGSNVQQIYDACVREFGKLDNGITFVNKSRIPASDSDKVTLISQTVNLPADAVGQSGYQTDFFLEYTYSDILVAFYRNNCEDDYNLDVFEKANLIEFEKDILSISFSLV